LLGCFGVGMVRKLSVEELVRVRADVLELEADGVDL